jgi:hypothetical protein
MPRQTGNRLSSAAWAVWGSGELESQLEPRWDAHCVQQSWLRLELEPPASRRAVSEDSNL